MKLFDVYPLFDLEPVKALGSHVWDKQGKQYLDLYGGHAVISIGHSHPHYIKRIQDQLGAIGFYSNSVRNSMQTELAEKLGRLSGCEEFGLFLCNSGAEAIENALKIASFHTGRKKVLALEGAFHGRTSGAVAITHNPKIQAPLNFIDHVKWIPFNDIDALRAELVQGDYCAVVAESIQGVGGIHVVSDEWWRTARELCNEHGTVLIADEIQAGFGRSGKFFAHQHAGIQPDLITMAKGMGNGFPIGGVLIHEKFEAWPGMLGTTFGGNHLACAACLAVLEVLESENLIENAEHLGTYMMAELTAIEGIKEVRGRGLMIGVSLGEPVKELRKKLLFEHQLFTGSSSDPKTLRLLPPLGLVKRDADNFLGALRKLLSLKSVQS